MSKKKYNRYFRLIENSSTIIICSPTDTKINKIDLGQENNLLNIYVSCYLMMLVRLQLCSHWSCGTVDWCRFLFQILRQNNFNNNNQASKMKVDESNKK